ncbi:unnamed protein product [Zymoseptoria tritici ST99CH_3D1]|nr:unnamed protein product [Zymoseptoria tritici ST99CH_3D1]
MVLNSILRQSRLGLSPDVWSSEALTSIQSSAKPSIPQHGSRLLSTIRHLGHRSTRTRPPPAPPEHMISIVRLDLMIYFSSGVDELHFRWPFKGFHIPQSQMVIHLSRIL